MSSESELIQAAIAGDANALESLLQLNHDRLFGYVKRHLPPEIQPEADPADIVQDTYLQACRRITTFTDQGSDSFFRWLVTISRNLMLELLRKRKVQRQHPDRQAIQWLEELSLYLHTPSRSAASHELIAALQRAIAHLPPHFAQAITSRYINGLSVEETARQMNRSPQAVYYISSRALQALRNEMKSI